MRYNLASWSFSAVSEICDEILASISRLSVQYWEFRDPTILQYNNTSY